MRKLEKVINVVTETKTNIAISTVTLLLVGYLVGFISIKVG